MAPQTTSPRSIDSDALTILSGSFGRQFCDQHVKSGSRLAEPCKCPPRRTAPDAAGSPLERHIEKKGSACLMARHPTRTRPQRRQANEFFSNRLDNSRLQNIFPFTSINSNPITSEILQSHPSGISTIASSARAPAAEAPNDSTISTKSWSLRCKVRIRLVTSFFASRAVRFHPFRSHSRSTAIALKSKQDPTALLRTNFTIRCSSLQAAG